MDITSCMIFAVSNNNKDQLVKFSKNNEKIISVTSKEFQIISEHSQD